jgi:hypothetical protein
MDIIIIIIILIIIIIRIIIIIIQSNANVMYKIFNVGNVVYVHHKQ